MANKITNPDDRSELYKLYIDLQEKLSEIEYIARRKDGWENAKAYWFGGLSVAINDDTYHSGGNSTFKSFLQDHGIADEQGNFIKEPDEDEESEEVENEDLHADA